MWYSRPATVLKPLGLYHPARRLWRKLHSQPAFAVPDALAEVPPAEPAPPPEPAQPEAPPPEVAAAPAVQKYPSHAVHPILTQPLPPIGPGPLMARIARIVSQPLYGRLVAELTAWPEDSTIISAERALLHWLITSENMQNVLEIGTYFAGTTRLMAASMEAKGSGAVHTIDPYGGDRAPGLLQRWPGAVADRVTFHAKYSTEYLMLMNRIPDFDLVFVDGNHSYANAFHDITASSDNASPHGYLIMDNAEQPDVIDATRDYLRLNPHLESALIIQEGPRVSCVDVFEYEGSAPCSAVVQINKAVLRPNKTYTYCAYSLPSLALGHLALSFRNPAPVTGTVSLHVHLRAISRDTIGTPEMFDLYEQYDFPVKDRESGAFDIQTKLALPERAAGFVIWTEISLRYKSNEAVSLEHFELKLNGRKLKIGRNFLDEPGT